MPGAGEFGIDRDLKSLHEKYVCKQHIVTIAVVVHEPCDRDGQGERIIARGAVCVRRDLQREAECGRQVRMVSGQLRTEEVALWRSQAPSPMSIHSARRSCKTVDHICAGRWHLDWARAIHDEGDR